MTPPRFQQLFVQLLRLWRPALSLGVVLIAMTGCIEWAQPMQSSELTVARYIAAVQDVAGTANAVLVKGAANPWFLPGTRTCCRRRPGSWRRRGGRPWKR